MEKKREPLRCRSVAEDDSMSWREVAGLNEIIDVGCYVVQLKHGAGNDELPLPDCDQEHYIAATLFVTESGTNDMLQKNRIVGQTLILSQCNDGQTGIYYRTFTLVNGEFEWSEWNSLLSTGQFNKIADGSTKITLDVKDNSITVQKLSADVRESISAKVERTSILQTTGNAADKVMSQKAVSDELRRVANIEVSDKTGNDLDFVDAGENCIVRFAEGHIITKNFDSRRNSVTEDEKTNLNAIEIADVNNCELVITDERKNAIFVINDGHILTKNFDSRTGVNGVKYIDRDIYALGDSTTQGAGSGTESHLGNKSWFDRLVTKIQFRSYRKLAVNGTTTVQQDGLSRLYQQINSLPVNGNPIILIMIGTNDINRSHTKGDATVTLNKAFEELNDTDNFADAYRYNLETIIRRLPNADVIAMTPVSPQPKEEAVTESYREIEREICKALSIPIWEVRNECGITKYCNYGYSQVVEEEIENAKVFMADTLHPNNAGYERIANYIAYKLNNYIQ